MSLTVQFYTMISMAVVGVWLGAAIDTYGRFVRQRRSFHWLTACQDVLFWLIQGLVVFYVLLESNYGEVRLYVFLAILLGYACYKALFEEVYKRLLEGIIRIIIRIYQMVTRLFTVMIILPVKYVLKLLYSLGMMIVTVTLSILLFMIRIVFKPLGWILTWLYKVTKLEKAWKKFLPFYLKIKGFIQDLRKKKE
ncbi:spore cortex biosynthesis protein YabQ [Bacillus sp. FJAT-45037]|uniref:spore cortex biosynthesis protein YabQ n=1 Tax=Bacillus sp. FJAT-45037 TaxID=2011007 RepID=UPI000C24FD36|nr:spore cortex biosynthesis protein YabQ [Bacillus sp. FJAT-45037]